MARLNAEQTLAVEYAGPARHLLVLAGAGTGKTTTIVQRVAHLVRGGTKPERILLLTFSRRAAKEMRGRLAAALGPVTDRLTIGTFHSFCWEVVSRIPKTFGVQAATVIDRDDATSLFTLARSERVEKGEKDFPKAAQIADWHSYARNCLLPLDAYLEKFTELPEDWARRVLAIAEAYTAKKRERHYIDYDDMLELLVRGLEKSTALRTQMQALYQHILVDEMQDTNPVQWRLLDLLREPAQLYCVGDDAQSIYAFRGADFRNVHAFSERVPRAAVLKLTENYRSTQEILDVSNWLLARSPLNYEKELRAARGHGVRPRLIDFASKFDEAAWLANDLRVRHEAGANWREHMILVRTAWSAKSIEAALIEADIPYTFIGGTSFLQAAHVKDVLALLRASFNRLDELAWVRYLTLWPKVGDGSAGKVVRALAAQAGTSVFDVLQKTLKNREEIAEGLHLATALAANPQAAVGAVCGHLEPLLATRYDRWEARKSDLRLLAQLAEKYSSVREFVETFTLDPVSNSEAAKTSEEDTVTLITVHSAKGTEAPVCYVAQAQASMYPHTRSLGDLDREEEERRILYVALTRAQNELILTRAGDEVVNIFQFGSTARALGEGYFLEELPPDIAEVTHMGFGGTRSALDALKELDDELGW
jgi:DNA helicase-2/ATP-dependent DNA helicase PcrA